MAVWGRYANGMLISIIFYLVFIYLQLKESFSGSVFMLKHIDSSGVSPVNIN